MDGQDFGFIAQGFLGVLNGFLGLFQSLYDSRNRVLGFLGFQVWDLGFRAQFFFYVQEFMSRDFIDFQGLGLCVFQVKGFILGFLGFIVLGFTAQGFLCFIGFSIYDLGFYRDYNFELFQVYWFLRVKCFVGFRVLNLGFFCSLQVQGLRIFSIQFLECIVLYGF